MRLTLFFLIILSGIATPLSSDASSVDSSRIYKAKNDISVLESAIDLFYRDNGRYPTTQEGLKSLVTPTKALEEDPNYNARQYLKRLRKDPWGNPYQYKSPGTNNTEKYDIWTYGADGVAGGEGLDSDYGNWEGSFEPYTEAVVNIKRYEAIWFAFLYGLPIGGLVGSPVYFFGIYRCIRQAKTLRASLIGFHLGVLIYLMLLIPIVAIALNFLPI
jgi:general secretion pathway protein G